MNTRHITRNDTWALIDNPTAQRMVREELLEARNKVLINSQFATKDEDKLSQAEIDEIGAWFDKLRDMPETGDISCLTEIPEKIKKHIGG